MRYIYFHPTVWFIKLYGLTLNFNDTDILHFIFKGVL